MNYVYLNNTFKTKICNICIVEYLKSSLIKIYDKFNDKEYYGEGPYYNIKKGIVKKETRSKGRGLYATEFIPCGTIVWKDRENGPTEKYTVVNIDDIKDYPLETREIMIKYGYQMNENEFLTPMTQEEIDIDYSNYWNHSCDPNCLPQDEYKWISIRDIHIGEELTIDYCTFDCNQYDCISRKYRKHFLKYIQDKIVSHYHTSIEDI